MDAMKKRTLAMRQTSLEDHNNVTPYAGIIQIRSEGHEVKPQISARNTGPPVDCYISIIAFL